MTRFNYHFLWDNIKPSTRLPSTLQVSISYHDYALASPRRPAFHLKRVVCFVRSAARMIDVIFSKAVSCGLDRTMLSDWLLEACAKTGDETLAKQYLKDLLPSGLAFCWRWCAKKTSEKENHPQKLSISVGRQWIFWGSLIFGEPDFHTSFFGVSAAWDETFSKKMSGMSEYTFVFHFLYTRWSTIDVSATGLGSQQQEHFAPTKLPSPKGK